jgi:hypothetical protein
MPHLPIVLSQRFIPFSNSSLDKPKGEIGVEIPGPFDQSRIL